VGSIAAGVYGYQLDVEVSQQTKQSVEPRLIGHMTYQVSQSSINVGGPEFSECGKNGRTQSSAYDHFECMDWHKHVLVFFADPAGWFSSKFLTSEVLGSHRVKSDGRSEASLERNFAGHPLERSASAGAFAAPSREVQVKHRDEVERIRVRRREFTRDLLIAFSPSADHSAESSTDRRRHLVWRGSGGPTPV
jgi:hypothetical protein